MYSIPWWTHWIYLKLTHQIVKYLGMNLYNTIQNFCESIWPSRPPLFPTITYLTPLTYNMHSSKLAERLTWTMGTSIKLWEGLQSSCPGATGKETGMTAPIIRYSVLSLPYWLLHCLLNTASRDVQFTTS